MELFKGDLKAKSPWSAPVALTLGNFDGVHKGHLHLFDQLKLKAQSLGVKSAVVSFSPHPAHILSGRSFLPLTTDQEKVARIEEAGIDCLVLQEFSPEFSKVSAEDFLRQYLVKAFDLSFVLFGFDYQFGKGGLGNFEMALRFFSKLSIPIEQATALRCQGERVSSSLIRSLLEQGEVLQASQMLGRPYQVTGQVSRGDQIGRQLGFPTANLSKIQTIIPKQGVYYCRALLESGESYKALVNIGTRPTVTQSGEDRVECHLLNFKEDLYDQMVTIEFVQNIRGEMKFDSREQLVAQIQSDIESVKRLSSH